MTENADNLLQEWFDWWYENDEAPAKLPNSLHTRTSVYLIERKYENEFDTGE